jgi:catechol 2,3-dioxygenase-like lactoylglutathione lyase family enzyme
MRSSSLLPVCALVAAAVIVSEALVTGVTAEGISPNRRTPAAANQHGGFTGEVLPVFYVTDVRRSVEFYGRLGFEFRHYFDYDEEREVPEWTRAERPIWALFSAGGFEFALHLTQSGDELVVVGNRHYFLVEDIDAHYGMVTGRGIEAGPLIDRPWMRMFEVVDPDGHQLFFGTRPG